MNLTLELINAEEGVQIPQIFLYFALKSYFWKLFLNIILMMEAASSYETSVSIYQTTWCNIPVSFLILNRLDFILRVFFTP
jgi:hypothetical protein